MNIILQLTSFKSNIINKPCTIIFFGKISDIGQKFTLGHYIGCNYLKNRSA